MNQRRRVALVAACATVLAAMPLAILFQTWTWAVEAVMAVALVSGTAIGTRALRGALWAQIACMVGALTLILTWLFRSGHEYLGLIPSPETFRHFGVLIGNAAKDIQGLGVPVPDRPGLLFLTTLGVGAVAIAVDVVAVSLRRPALAGFPMLAMYWIPVVIKQHGLNPVPFILGALAFCWLLVTDNVDRVRRFGRRFTADGRDVDLWEPSPLASAGRRLTVIGVLVAILLPMATPAMSSTVFDRFGGGGGGGSGPGSGNGPSVSLFAMLSGNLGQQRPFNMVRVTTNDPSPYYLRFAIADQVVETGFRDRAPGGGTQATAGVAGPTVSGAGVSTQKYRASVDIINFDMQFLPIYTSVTKAQKLASNWLIDKDNQLLYSNRERSKGKKYSFDYVSVQFSREALRAAPELTQRDPMWQYTQVPKNTAADPVVEPLVQRLTDGKTTEYDKVLALYTYFSQENGFRYSLSTKSGTAGSDIANFLTNKQGYCEQYAAALAWMVRAAGIPARVAFGFTRGADRQGSTYTMTNLNLHAWTEVYFPTLGWVPFDATPTSGIAGSVSPAWAPDVNHNNAVTDVPRGSEASPDPNSSGAAGGPNANKPNPDAGHNGPSAGVATGKASTWPLWLLGGLLLALSVASIPALTRAVTRRRRRPGRLPRSVPVPAAAGEPPPHNQMRVVPDADPAAVRAVRRRVHAAWDELIDTLIDYRMTVDRSETPRATAERVAGSVRAAGDGVRLLGRAEERARYARLPTYPEELGAALRATRRAIAGSASRRTRLRAVVLPSSVLHRWRTAMTETSVAVSATVERRWLAVTRVVHPRNLLGGRATHG
jgi:transglutaminase-like putative cysteine protease